MTTLKLTVPAKVQRRFKLRACRAFPAEAFSFILGRKIASGITIVDFWYPSDLVEYSDDEQVEVPVHWLKDVVDYAYNVGLDLLGTVHTHTYSWEKDKGVVYEPVPSLGDFKGWQPYEQVIGIANVAEGSNGRRKCSDIQFFAAPPMLTQKTV